MIVLGIESSCDETAAAVVKNGREILSHAIASSSDIHERYGGVFPELACRRHIDAILPVIEEALEKAQVKPEKIDLIAVTKGPGLIGALLIGMQAAKGLAIAWEKPLIGVNHIEAHLYAAMMTAPEPWVFPALGLVLSGGHTLLLQIEDVGKYQQIGTTVDDALGEAFDKVAALLGFPYPGGPHVENWAVQGNPKRFLFKAGKVKRSPYDFSFSGIKTSVLYAVNDLNFGFDPTRPQGSFRDLDHDFFSKIAPSAMISKKFGSISSKISLDSEGNEPKTQVNKEKFLFESDKADVAASFQEAVFADIVKKTELALGSYPAKALYLGGGVCNNQRLRALFATHFSLPTFWPAKDLSLDNAVMIAGLGFQKFHQCKQSDPLDLEAAARIPIA